MPGTRGVVGVGNVDLDPQRARLRIDRLRRARNLAAEKCDREGCSPVIFAPAPPAFISSPATLCGTSTKTRIGFSWLTRYSSVLPVVLPGGDQIADIDATFRDRTVEGCRDLLEPRQSREAVYARLIECDLRTGGVQLGDGAVIVRSLGLALLLGDHAFGRIAPALVGALGELRLRCSDLDLRFGGRELGAGGGQIGVQLRASR